MTFEEKFEELRESLDRLYHALPWPARAVWQVLVFEGRLKMWRRRMAQRGRTACIGEHDSGCCCADCFSARHPHLAENPAYAKDYEEGYRECAACSAKPGAPALCTSCLHNRKLVACLRDDLEASVKEQGYLQEQVQELENNAIGWYGVSDDAHDDRQERCPKSPFGEHCACWRNHVLTCCYCGRVRQRKGCQP